MKADAYQIGFEHGMERGAQICEENTRGRHSSNAYKIREERVRLSLERECGESLPIIPIPTRMPLTVYPSKKPTDWGGIAIYAVTGFLIVFVIVRYLAMVV